MLTRVIAVLDLPRRINDVINFAQSVATHLKGNPALPAPIPPLTVFDADIAALVAAEALAWGRGKGDAEARDVKLLAVVSGLDQILAYVQGVADVNATTAESIITSAGLRVRTAGSHTKGAIQKSLGVVPGVVTVSVKAVAHRAAYDWQISTDQKTWTSAPPTLQSKTVFTGLTVGLTYYFQMRPLTKDGLGEWGPVASQEV